MTENKKLSKPRSYVDDNDEVMELDAEWFRTATFVNPKQVRKSISLRIDPNLLDWFRSFGPGYQSRMHAVLAAYAQAHRGRGVGKKKPRP